MSSSVSLCRASNFYPRPPRGGRHAGIDTERLGWIFLSTPSARRATAGIDTERLGWIFLSTPSARRATRYPCAGVRLHLISIHALREEGDDGAIQSGDSSTDFYPRPPRGGRRLR